MCFVKFNKINSICEWLILTHPVSENRIFDLFALKKQWWSVDRLGASNIANKAVTNKQGLHLFTSSHIIGGREFDGKVICDINNN